MRRSASNMPKSESAVTTIAACSARSRISLRRDVVGLEVRVVREDLITGPTCGELTQHHRHRDAEITDARQPAHPLRVDRDSLQVHVAIVAPRSRRGRWTSDDHVSPLANPRCSSSYESKGRPRRRRRSRLQPAVHQPRASAHIMARHRPEQLQRPATLSGSRSRRVPGSSDMSAKASPRGRPGRLLDRHPGDGPADHELLDLLGAFEDVVVHPP